MKGLLLKDFYIIRSGLLILLLTFVFVGAGMSFLISPLVLIVIFTVTLSFQSAVTVQTDKVFCYTSSIKKADDSK